jgi:dolichol-phosphate mannosyltransferase
MSTTYPQISVVVPVYNEQAGLESFHASLSRVLKQLDLPYEVIYCNDGSRDETLPQLRAIADHDEHVRFLSFSRNFGKELAVSAGIHRATGKAILMLDADGQHPVELIPEFIAKWQAGANVVIGVRTNIRRASLLKRFGSKLFYATMSRLAGTYVRPGSTDYRLISQVVQQSFNTMPERNRLTRGLIDWLGFDRTYIEYEEKVRTHGDSTYSVKQLSKLFVDSIISVSSSPLYFVAYLGAVVLPVALVLGLVMVINGLTGDHLNIHATGSAYVNVLTLCLVGILMVSQGIIGLYLSHIHTESQDRPLYVIDEARSSLK